MVQRVNYDTLPEAVGPYVHATKHNETLYLSGLTALATKAQAGGFQEQCAEVLAQIEGVLKQEKRSKGDIVKVTIFLKILLNCRRSESNCLPSTTDICPPVRWWKSPA